MCVCVCVHACVCVCNNTLDAANSVSAAFCAASAAAIFVAASFFASRLAFRIADFFAAANLVANVFSVCGLNYTYTYYNIY